MSLNLASLSIERHSGESAICLLSLLVSWATAQMEGVEVQPKADGAARADVNPCGDPPKQGWPIRAGRHQDEQPPARGNYDAIS